MNSAKNMIWLVLALAVAGGIAGVLIVKRQMVKEGAVAAPQQQPARIADEAGPAAPPAEAPPPVAEVPAPAAAPVAPESTPSAPPTKSDARRPSPPAQAGQGGTAAREPLQDPVAREALAFVGADPMAEAYWYTAINDPNLPAKERQDLIEDLNEDGISDPKHPSPEDLPVILRRIQLLEAMDEMDQVNADAKTEALKDLGNLANLAVGGGEAVK